jgi:hydroxymethylbilane synthase
MFERVLAIGTRGSDLAVEQARRVRAGVTGPAELRVIQTSGDRFADKPLGEATQIGFFTKEIEEELLGGRIDIAVHSLKDLPTTLAPGLELGAVLARDDPADVLLLRPDRHAPGRRVPVQEGSRVGASSLRRQALLKMFAGDLVPTPIRGNVPTRVRKAINGETDAVILSRAGLERLKLDVSPLLAYELNPRIWTCAPGQATIAVEIRDGDNETRDRLSNLHDEETWAAVQAERSQLASYGGGCHVPFGAYAGRINDGFELFVAAPGTDEFVVERFKAETLDEASRSAGAWIRAGRPKRISEGVDDWLSRPARSWS